MTIGWIEISGKKYGGVIYNEEARNALAGKFNIELVLRKPVWFSRLRYLRIPESLFRLLSLKGERDVWVRDFYSTLTLPFDRTKGKNIVVMHHDDFSGFPLLARPFFFLAQRLFYRNLKKVDSIVTVSEYWKQHFVQKGYKNVHLIYNGFNLDRFEVSDKEVEVFKKRHNLREKPIIYLGNCQKAKGVIEAYRALQGMDAHLVTSGRRAARIPARNLELEYREYLCLLKAASVVVTMSRFKEGWCRTAHEAMLLGTPVIGSGKGGMRELLEGGGQLICEHFSVLREKVEYLLLNPEVRAETGERGHAYAKMFSQERFHEAWIEFIWKVTNA
ncbi:MAG: glycosyltransferase family 4 protein [Candidatus Yanofskybacteria bacterium]|nr:glycosyltransferase family 4 protein [Candidatus Yanofskybacteria bacterium]